MKKAEVLSHSVLSDFATPWTVAQASLVAQRLRIRLQCSRCRLNPWGWEDPLEEGMATYSSILAWEIPWTTESGGLQSMMLQRVGHD